MTTNDSDRLPINKTVVVIGGGLSGLCAATKLIRGGVSSSEVTVLEARDRVGGRTCTDEDGVDLGGAYVGPTQDRILRVAKQFNIATKPVYNPPNHTNVLHIKGDRREYVGLIPRLSLFSLLDTNHVIRKMEEMAKDIDCDKPWEHKHAVEWDSMTVQEWINLNVATEETRIMTTGVIQGIVCAEPAEVSILAWLTYVKSAGGFLRMTSVENGAQERKFVGGSQRISDALAASLGNVVQLNQPVVRLEWQRKPKQDGDTVQHKNKSEEKSTSKSSKIKKKEADNKQDAEETVEEGNDGEGEEKTRHVCRIHTRNGQIYESAFVIVALAPPLYSSLGFDPALPPLKRELSMRMPMGCIIKTVTTYSRPFWRDDGFNGTVFSDRGPIMFSYDDCKEEEGKFAVMGFILAKFARSWCQASYEERKRAVCHEYALMFRNDEALVPISYKEKNWNAEEFSGGCYGAFTTPTTLAELGPALRRPLGQCVHFAGTELATKWMGYMDGAVQSGERAAHEVLEKLSIIDSRITHPHRFVDEPPSKDVVPRPFQEDFVEKLLPSPRTIYYVVAALFVAASACLVKKYMI